MNAKPCVPILTIDDIEKALESGNYNIHKQIMGHVEKILLDKALVKARGNQTVASRNLGIARETLRVRLVKYGMYKTN